MQFFQFLNFFLLFLQSANESSWLRCRLNRDFIFQLDTPYCYYPQNYALYKHQNSTRTENEEIHTFNKIKQSGYPNDVSNLILNVTCFDENILRIRIEDSDKSRYEVPFTNFENSPESLENCQLEFILADFGNLRFQVKRKSSGEVL